MMNLWILIPLVAIIGGLIVEYQKNKLRFMEKSRQNQVEVGELRSEIKSLKKRIENLEAIASAEPDQFSESSGQVDPSIEIEDEWESMKKENKEKVANLANKKRSRT